ADVRVGGILRRVGMRQLQWLFVDPQSAFNPTTGFQARLRCICCQETAYTKDFRWDTRPQGPVQRTNQGRAAICGSVRPAEEHSFNMALNRDESKAAMGQGPKGRTR